jgi:hypothetical protein
MNKEYSADRSVYTAIVGIIPLARIASQESLDQRLCKLLSWPNIKPKYTDWKLNLGHCYLDLR